MIELDYNNLIAHREVARRKIITIKEEQDNLEKSTDICKNPEGRKHSIRNTCIIQANKIQYKHKVYYGTAVF